MRRYALLFLLFPLIVSADDQATLSEQIDAMSAAHLSANNLPGLAVTVARGQDVIYSNGFGFADLEQRVPVLPSLTRFRVGSTAKSMTAFAIGQLVESGKLDIDVPIQNYLPDYPQKVEGSVTTRQLAGHLAGVRSYEGNEWLIDEPYDSVQAGLAIFRNDPLLSAPGTAYYYSTYGYNLISAVLEAAAGQPFLEYMQRNVFDPLHMSRTAADQVTPLISYRARYYDQQDGELVNSPWVNNSHKWAGGGFLSTSEDLVRFVQAHLTTRHLSQATIDLLWTPQKTTDGTVIEYGIGWFLRPDRSGRPTVGHTGGSVGGTTVMRLYRDEGLIIVAITNLSDGSVSDLADNIADLYFSK